MYHQSFDEEGLRKKLSMATVDIMQCFLLYHSVNDNKSTLDLLDCGRQPDFVEWMKVNLQMGYLHISRGFVLRSKRGYWASKSQ